MIQVAKLHKQWREYKGRGDWREMPLSLHSQWLTLGEQNLVLLHFFKLLQDFFFEVNFCKI
jgi:hypothetical protein